MILVGRLSTWAALGCIGVACLTTLACQSNQTPYTQIEGHAQGTTFSIIYRDSLHRTFDRSIDSLFRVVDRSMSLWDTTSLICRINRNETDVVVDDHFAFVFHRAQEIADWTEGAFDITSGPLVNAWGFSRIKQDVLPDSTTIRELLQHTGYQKVQLEKGRVSKNDASIQLDFNGIAQGYTVDLIADFLEDHFIRDYLVEVGGELRTAGRNERGDIWQVGIDNPNAKEGEGRLLQTHLALDHAAMATSGNYRKYVTQDGKRRTHIIDPSTGYPVLHTLVSATVKTKDCTSADALATACMVAGTEKALVMAETYGFELYGILLNENGTWSTLETEGFRK